MLSRIHQITIDGCLAQLPAGFQPVQAFHQYEAIAVTPQQDGCFLTHLQNALGNLLHSHLIER